MTKKLLLIVASLVTLGLSAQHKVKNTQLIQATIPSPATLDAAKTMTGQTCDSIVTMNLQTSTITVGFAGTDSTVPTCTVKAGYVYGTNCYGDQEKAEYFDGATWYGSVPNLSVHAVQVLFWHDPAAGMGTQGAAAANIGMKFYNGNLTSGPTGAAIGATQAPMATVLSFSTANDFFFYEFKLPTPVAVAGAGFFASVMLPVQNPGDTAVIASEDTPSQNFVWEKFDDNTWHPVTQPSVSWGAPGNLLVIPKYCFNITTSVTQNLGISKNIDIFPNPTSGIVRIQSSFINDENLEITITNMLGEVVRSVKRTTNIELMSFDISNQPNGVYFVSVSNGTDKMVTRLILNK